MPPERHGPSGIAQPEVEAVIDLDACPFVQYWMSIYKCAGIAGLAVDTAFGRLRRFRGTQPLEFIPRRHAEGHFVGLRSGEQCEQQRSAGDRAPLGRLVTVLAINRANDLADMPADVERAPRLDLTHHRDHVGAGDGTKIDVAEGGRRIPLKPDQKPRCVVFVE